MAAGISLTWATSEGYSTNYTVTAIGLGQFVVYTGTSPTFSFTSAGSKEVTLLIQDKDGLYDQKTWRYYVSPSKALLLYPRQPDQLRGRGGNLSAFSAFYTGAAGIGDGRVWSDGAVVDFTKFIHKYTFDPTVAAVNIYARGYKVGDVDDGSLLPGPDIVIDADGNHHKEGAYSTYYTSTELEGLDSFFYCWILNATGENGGGYTGSLLNGTFLPAVEAKGEHVADGMQRVTLPEYEEDAESYFPTELEAIFSKELYPSDNVGDINQDGIPDVYAVKRTYDGGPLYQFATGAAAGGEGGETASASDIKPMLTAFNGDGDYLPPATITGGGIPATADGWQNVGQPFTADQEVRGFHWGLNYRVGNSGLNYNVIGKWVSEPCFSAAETNAVAFKNGLQTWTDFQKEHAEDEDEAYATALAEWQAAFNAKLQEDKSWIPENRTDPTKADTDDDGFPDGFEYYFWYRASVGWIDDQGEWKRLEGERFQLQDIAKGVPISSDEIAVLFNPTVKATGDITRRDSDNDGLTDLEELAMGTNPLHWDTDGDGMSDLWEVMRGMNPLKAPGQGETNLDGDAMASFTTEKTYAIATFTDAAGKKVFYAVSESEAARISAIQEAAWVAAEREAREAAERAERLEAGRSVLSNMRKTEDKVEKITYYEHSREPVYADSRCFVLPYLEQRGDQVWLRIKYWYTDDDWLFWSSLTIVADEERFERSFSYFNVTRDNEDGMIWEYVDVRAGDRDIAMLDAIADSEETIVRFNGQQYYDDFTVPGADKKAIRDVLAAYEYLKAQSAQ